MKQNELTKKYIEATVCDFETLHPVRDSCLILDANRSRFGMMLVETQSPPQI